MIFSLAAFLLAPVFDASRQQAPAHGEAPVRSDADAADGDLRARSPTAEPPSPAKLALIRRYLVLTGTQRQIDSGSFLQHYALPGGRLTPAVMSGGGEITFREIFSLPMDALRRAYEPHRHVWQEEYEGHVHGEYDEDELRRIVGFLETDTGQHFLEGERRMDAYIGTNTEALVEHIIQQAEASLRASPRE